MIATSEALTVFDERKQADLAIEELLQAGFLRGQIAIARQRTTEESREADAADSRALRRGLARLKRFLGSILRLGKKAKLNETNFQEGRTIMRVQADGRCDKAMDIMQRHGGYNRKTQQSANPQDCTGKPVSGDAKGSKRLGLVSRA